MRMFILFLTYNDEAERVGGIFSTQEKATNLGNEWVTEIQRGTEWRNKEYSLNDHNIGTFRVSSILVDEPLI